MVLGLTNLYKTLSKAVSEASGQSAIKTCDMHLNHLMDFFHSSEYTFLPENLQPFFFEPDQLIVNHLFLIFKQLYLLIYKKPEIHQA